jgi:pyruvate kinase
MAKSSPSPISPDANRTKIVATLGPATENPATIQRLAEAGVDVFRINFSHGSRDQHRRMIQGVRRASEVLEIPLAILGDLAGPKLRVGHVKNNGVRLETGDIATFVPQSTDDSDPPDGTEKIFSVNFDFLHETAAPGQAVLLDDGQIRMTVREVSGNAVRCRVENPGTLSSNKGINLPDTDLPVPAFTENDRDDLAFALETGIDLVALSFIRRPEDLDDAREAMHTIGTPRPLLAKIEKAEALDHLEAILDKADGAMVARGDLGVEIPMEQVPPAQKRIIRLCNLRGIPVITATQMLDSMIRNPAPTRAEVTDVYNAILDGADAVMLSGETAIGHYPVRAVEAMDRVAGQAEKIIETNRDLDWLRAQQQEPSTGQVIAYAAVTVASRLNLDCILAPTWSGATARRVSQFRPATPIFACSPAPEIVLPLSLVWGVTAAEMEHVQPEEARMSEADALIEATIRCAREHGAVHPGMRVVLLGGVPLGKTNHTNFLRVMEIQES